MSRVLSPLLVVLVLVVAACGEESADTTLPPGTEVTPQPVLLSYEFEPGTELRYEVRFDQHITISASGEPTALGGEDIPGDADLDVSGVTTFTHTVEAGAEPGTYEITIVGDFTDLELSGVLDGEPVESGEFLDFAQIEPVETTVTVDEQGNVLSSTDDEFGLGGELGGELTGLASMASPGMDLGSLVGPSLSEREVTVGDTWSETIENPVPFGGAVITTSVENEVTGTDTMDGVEVFVIETNSSTSMIEFDLGEMMVGFFEAFMSAEATAEERAELEAMLEGLRFLIVVDPSSYRTTTWFDHTAGHSLRSESVGTTQMTYDINFPDEASGEMMAFTMDMTMDQKVAHRLLDAGSA
jgi:hypothetical protein